MKVKKDAVVTIDYTLRNDEGEVLDSSEENGELSYLHGHQGIVEGLEEALEGKSEGEKVEATLDPEKAYGERDERLLFDVGRDRMPDDVDLEVGMQFLAQGQDGSQRPVTVSAIGDDKVTLDGNHPLAGERLHFDVTINGIREATDEEIDHGHVHDGNHHH
ncbi:MAG: peptidylprolyl isomerase [Spirochaetaceae bacterium]